MNENFSLPENLPDCEKYELLLPYAKGLLSADDRIVTNLANFCALLKQAFSKISWVGFYIFDGQGLYLGPFQGNIACTYIALGKGVCGAAAMRKETVIVANVHEFEGHIACDSGSNSEIVLPIINGGKLFGVLDLDSYRFSAFDETDKQYLEQLVILLSRAIFNNSSGNGLN